MGGLQYQRNFANAPLLITYPEAAVSGTAVVPSTVDIYIGNARAYSTQVRPGPFSLSNLPVPVGAGNVRVVVRDVFGKETTAVVPYVRYDAMLKKGLARFFLRGRLPAQRLRGREQRLRELGRRRHPSLRRHRLADARGACGRHGRPGQPGRRGPGHDAGARAGGHRRQPRAAGLAMASSARRSSSGTSRTGPSAQRCSSNPRITWTSPSSPGRSARSARARRRHPRASPTGSGSTCWGSRRATRRATSTPSRSAGRYR